MINCFCFNKTDTTHNFQQINLSPRCSEGNQNGSDDANVMQDLILFDRSKYHRECRKRSKQIEKELKKSGKLFKSTIKLLLLGPGESGKSTVVKQMRIIHTSKFSTKERQEKIIDIKSNVRDSILSILDAMERFKMSLEDENLREKREFVFENAHLLLTNPGSLAGLGVSVGGGGLPNGYSTGHHVGHSGSGSGGAHNDKDLNKNVERLWDCIEELWKDGGVKKCAKRGNEFHLIDSAQYFLDRISVIRARDFLPDDQDILRCRVLTTGILETKFLFKNVSFHIFDVGGQRDQRRKWIQCFNQVTAIIFVVDISSFNMTLREDYKMNRLRESLHSFRSIWINRYLYHISIILFLNKYDILVEKILTEQAKLQDYFPEYEDFETPAKIDKHLLVPNEDPEVTRAKMFILDQFIKITNEKLSDALYEVSKYNNETSSSMSATSPIAVNGNDPQSASLVSIQMPEMETKTLVNHIEIDTKLVNEQEQELSQQLLNTKTNEIGTHQEGARLSIEASRRASNFRTISNMSACNIIRYDPNNNTLAEVNEYSFKYESKLHKQIRAAYKEAEEESLSGKFCIPYFTCAVDTENIKRVFKACSHILKKEHLEKSGLL